MRLLRLTILFLLTLVTSVHGEALTRDTVWQGEVVLDDDVVVPHGVTLTVAAGTRVLVMAADSTKIDPEYISHQNEITVRGTLRVQGTDSQRVVFGRGGKGSDDTWAGIIVDHGEAVFEHAEISGAEIGVYLIGGTVTLADTVLRENRYGLVLQEAGGRLAARNVLVEQNEYGLMAFDNAVVEEQELVVRNNGKKDRYQATVESYPLVPPEEVTVADAVSRYYKDEALPGKNVWQGRVVIDGLVRLPPEARLLIMPGTVVEFTRRDTNNDGIGENGLMVQGLLIAKGTPEKQIIFRSAEKIKARGDWDSINILGSDQAQNLIEFCRIEDAYRGMHFHYANVAVNQAVIRHNYRGIQFQESVVSITGSRFFDNLSAIQARDSEVFFQDNELVGNQTGANFFRLNLEATGNIIANNGREGMRIREGASTVTGNLLAGNRFGLLVADAVFGRFDGNILQGNLETGIAIRNTDHLEISGNIIQANGLNGVVIRESRGTITGNLINENGERGIGVMSYAGAITANNFAANGLYAIGLEGPGDVQAGGNWWGGSDLGREIYDRHDEPGLGEVHFDPPRDKPVAVTWPGTEISLPAVWAGSILVPEMVTVATGGSLAVRPGTMTTFGVGSGLVVNGRITAVGTADQRITFTGIDPDRPASWEEISLQQALPSRFSYCDIHAATWGIHSHFTSLTIDHCRLTGNDGGLRFRSGPLLMTGSLVADNRIGFRAYQGIGTFRENSITRNEIGVYVRERGGDVELTNNNIFANERYNIRLGDFNREDLRAAGNWWGGSDPVDTFFDARREPGIGMVIYEPFLDKPLPLEIEAPASR